MIQLRGIQLAGHLEGLRRICFLRVPKGDLWNSQLSSAEGAYQQGVGVRKGRHRQQGEDSAPVQPGPETRISGLEGQPGFQPVFRTYALIPPFFQFPRSTPPTCAEHPRDSRSLCLDRVCSSQGGAHSYTDCDAEPHGYLSEK